MRGGIPLSDDESSYPRADLLLYVSGQMPVEQIEVFEQRLLDDGAFSAAVESAEFALLDDFAADALSLRERQQVAPWIERSPRRRRHVRIAQQLYRNKTQRTFRFIPARVPAFAWGALAAGLLLCVLIPLGWTARHHRQPAAVSKMSTVPTGTQAPVVLAQQDTILLVAGRLRGAGTADNASKPTTFDVHADHALRVQVLLPASATADAFAVTLQSGDPSNVRQFSDLASKQANGSRFVELLLPLRSLSPGPQRIELRSPQSTYTVRFTLHIVPGPEG